MVSSVLSPEDPDVGNTKAIICVKLKDLICAHDEWLHLVQVSRGYLSARTTLALLGAIKFPRAGFPTFP
jgi:hypothetical protein